MKTRTLVTDRGTTLGPSETSGLPTQTAFGPLVVLCVALLSSWAVYAVVVRPFIPVQSSFRESLIGAASRLLFWGVPCAVYLWRYWRHRFCEPLGLGFPLGRPQVIRTVVATLVVGVLLVIGTGIQKDVAPTELLRLLMANARPNLQAPVFEELVFRGVIVSELMNWVHDQKGSLHQLRVRFWGAQFFGALVFLLVHWPWWLTHHGLMATLALSPPVLVTGLILGLLFAYTRSVWGCMLVHWLNNELSGLG